MRVWSPAGSDHMVIHRHIQANRTTTTPLAPTGQTRVFIPIEPERMLDNQEIRDERPIISGDGTLCIVDLLRPHRAWMFDCTLLTGSSLDPFP